MRLSSLGAMTPQNLNGTTPTAPHDRALWVAIALLAGVVIGVTAGWLTWLGGVAVSLAVVAGGASFGATVGLVIMLIKYVLNNE